VDSKRRKVLDKTRDGCGIGLLPVGPEAVQTTQALRHGTLTGRFFDVVEDRPPVGLE
jgi:hypothetical protein